MGDASVKSIVLNRVVTVLIDPVNADEVRCIPVLIFAKSASQLPEIHNTKDHIMSLAVNDDFSDLYYCDGPSWIKISSTSIAMPDQAKLDIANIVDGQYLRRIGTNVIGDKLILPELTSDPESPGDGEVWILRTVIGMSDTYEISVKTINNGIKRIRVI